MSFWSSPGSQASLSLVPAWLTASFNSAWVIRGGSSLSAHSSRFPSAGAAVCGPGVQPLPSGPPCRGAGPLAWLPSTGSVGWWPAAEEWVRR